MVKNSIAQDPKVALHQGQVERMRQMRSQYTPGTPEWQEADDALFEARCALRVAQRALRMAGRRWRCIECGEEYGPDWVASWGLVCHAECGYELVEVKHG
ncbi:MAG: hypothetical protein NZN28_11970 [Meiothermus sp.]|uniref:hypothetical protein n=1 Tax=Meiothermus sp. TaxID=1955249 RepID=UPI0025F85B06|nr:hypothetical protein [Meiothermus sp.]MCS7069329.1 hypothetical protein [Meiothermus sp.]